MEIEVIERNKNRVVMNIMDSDHTFCNILKHELWNDDRIKNSSYSIEHPLVGEPRMVVEVKQGTDVTDAISDAVDRVKDTNKEFLKKFKKAM